MTMVNKMNNEEEKATLFISRLLSNPSLNYLSPLQKEDQIVSFLELNSKQLYATLSSPAFFPGKPWPEIISILETRLRSVINSMVDEGLKRFLFEKIDFSFLSGYGKSPGQSEMLIKSMYTFILKSLKTFDGRKDFGGSYNALLCKLPSRYINAVFGAQSYIHFELTKVQRLKMSKEEITNMIRATLLLRPVVHIYSESVHDRSTGLITKQYSDKVKASIKKDLPLVPEVLLSSAVDSNLSFEKYKFIPTTGRLTSIFNNMARTIRPNMKIDRGASSPEKSWLSVGRRNYKYYGWDIKMLDELYRFSLENGW